MQKLIITQPDDWHIHLRDGDFLKTTVPDAAQRFARAIVMPNLKPPVTTVAAAKQYRDRILSVLKPGSNFLPLMTLYLTDNVNKEEIKAAKTSGIIYGCKLYPAGATTNSAAGVTNLEKIYPALETMQEVDLPLLIHGEVTDADVDIFDREKIFLQRSLLPITQRFPQLKIVLEHITTKESADFIRDASKYVAATITAHHLLLNRNDLLASGIKPHHYCLPIVKREQHREALLQAATSGNPKFFLGSDSAPHAKSTKENSCGCAGIYTANAGIEIYAEIFDKAQALDKLEGFASFFGADFYQLPRNKTQITLIKKDWVIPEHISFGQEQLIPFKAGESISWQIENFK